MGCNAVAAYVFWKVRCLDTRYMAAAERYMKRLAAIRGGSRTGASRGRDRASTGS